MDLTAHGIFTQDTQPMIRPDGTIVDTYQDFGAAAGREVILTKVVTTVGKPGVQVASITKRPTGYVLAHVEGAARPTVNSTPLAGETVSLKNGDVIDLAGTPMQFVQAA